jgi:thiol:disulfide interchange protein DsbD
MKNTFKLVILIVSLLISTAVSAQIFNPVKWSTSVKRISETDAELIINAKIENKWHLYSSKASENNELGPIPTEFTFTITDDYELVGKIIEGKAVKEYDPNFDMVVSYFTKSAKFVQKIKLKNKGSIKITGNVNYMVCDDQRCLPPTDEELIFEIPEYISGNKENNVTTTNSEKLINENENINKETDDLIPKNDIQANKNDLQETKIETKEITNKTEENSSLWLVFIQGLIGGFAALLMPCIYPMLPLTVSFFTKQSKTKAEGIRKATIYGFSIIVIYVLLGMVVTILFGSDALNELSTDPWFNIFFFVLFVIFALSFFGAFELTLPSSWVNKADAASNKGGLIGIFFMAATLSLVSFSCTGPIIGTLLVQAANEGQFLGPAMGMFGFSFALAIPFALFAAFPGWLNSLPKSGGWLNTVKVTLGFIELALALKFLSNADLVLQAGWLKRELFLAIWIGIFGLMSMYLLGIFRMPHDSPVNELSIPRLLVAMASLIFTIYLIPGMWGAPLKIISGFPPPQFYSESPNGLGGNSFNVATSISKINSEIPKGSDPAHCPHNLNCFHDYKTGLEYAKKVGKPIMLDFTGWACVNCRKMEEQVWSDPEVLKRLNEDFVLISLYVDEKQELPLDEQIEVEIGGKKKKLKTVGNKWSHFQATVYGNNSQPFYVILDHNEKMLIEPAAYDPDIQKFINWLDRGKAEFQKNLN